MESGTRRDGAVDAYPESGEFTTTAMAEGAIDGTAGDYELREPFQTDFAFSRYLGAIGGGNDATIDTIGVAESE